MPFPKPLSPQAHRRFDTLVPPGAAALAALVARRDPAAATLILMVGVVEGAVQLTTDYPPPVALRWISFRQHVRIANIHGAFIAALALLVPGVRRRSRAFVLGLAAAPLLLNALSDVEESDRQLAARRLSAR